MFTLSPVASAHHGWSGNLDEEFDLTGTVETGVSLAGPHATMKCAQMASYGTSHWRRQLEPLVQA
jgi:hypothetical protein